MSLLVVPMVQAVYYDAEKNMYVYETVPAVSTSTTTTSTTTTDNGNKVIIITSDQTTTTESDDDDETEIDPENISSVVTTFVIQDHYDGALEYMHDELEDHRVSVLQDLEKKYINLRVEITQKQGDEDRLEVMQCLGIVANKDNLTESLRTSYKDLQNNIGSTAADLHNDIDALEVKIDNDFLASFTETLETAALQNKTDAYLSEYTTMVQLFRELSESELSEADLDLDDEEKKLLSNYDKRVALYTELEDAYDEFIHDSSFAGVLAGPNLQELTELTNGLETYYESVLMQTWIDKVVLYMPVYGEGRNLSWDTFESLRSSFKQAFEEEVEGLLGGLYAADSFQAINKSVLTLRSAYTHSKDEYDCEAFATNETIDLAAEQLTKNIKQTLKDLSQAVKDVDVDGEMPKTIEELKEGLIDGLEEKMKTVMNRLLDRYKRDLDTSLELKSLSKLTSPLSADADKWEMIVRKFLQQQYVDHLDDDRLDSFIRKLEKADKEVVAALEIATGRAKQMLESIGKVIKEFL